MSPPFRYEPLSGSDRIRLVHLGKDDKAPHGFKVGLSETNLQGGTAFQALSYTWGLPYQVDIIDLEKPNPDNGDVLTISVDGNNGNDSEVTITENLFYALKQLIINAKGGHIAPLWIDALCINQRDEAEKASQVSMMADIYSTAFQVVVWLGKDDPAPRFLAVHGNRELETFLTDVAMGKQDSLPATDALRKMGLESLQGWHDMWWDYVCFYRRQRYFRRAWIIQETALAREITVLCGSLTLDWTRLVVIGNLLQSAKLDGHWNLLGSRTAELLQRPSLAFGNEIRQLHMFRTDHRLNGGLPMHLHRTKANVMRGRQDHESDDVVTAAILKSLGALGDKRHKEYAYFAMVLRQFSDYQATDKRDHVFAALEFCRPFFRKAGVEPPIVPSYEITVQEVFAQVTAKLLDSLPLLSVLSYVADEKKIIPGLPSWVPDFSAQFTNRPLIFRGAVPSPGKVTPDGDATEYEPIYNASRAGWPVEGDKPLAVVDGYRLRVSGTYLGTVEAINPAAFRITGEFRYLPYLEFAAAALPATYAPTGQDRTEALWRTIIGDLDDHGDQESEYPASVLTGTAWMRRHMTENLAGDLIATLADGGGDLAPYRAELSRVSAVLGTLAGGAAGTTFVPGPAELALQIAAYSGGAPVTPEAEMACLPMVAAMGLAGRRMYTTAEGALGVGPSGIRRGDEVWVIRGARVPFVLRRREGAAAGEFTLLGETYVHGAMDGDMLDEKGPSAMEITLC